MTEKKEPAVHNKRTAEQSTVGEPSEKPLSKKQMKKAEKKVKADAIKARRGTACVVVMLVIIIMSSLSSSSSSSSLVILQFCR